jgi:hypothetical protein
VVNTLSLTSPEILILPGVATALKLVIGKYGAVATVNRTEIAPGAMFVSTTVGAMGVAN